jgi:DNA polymerase
VAADYAQIELRVAAWLADERWLIDALAQGEDVYKITAADIYHIPLEEVNGEQRQRGKTVELASQFGLGGKGLKNRLAEDGVTETLDTCQAAIDAYRQGHPAIVDCWQEMQNSFEMLMPHSEIGTALTCADDRVVMTRLQDAIKVTRPSGFSQYYWLPRWFEDTWPDGGPRMSIGYYGRGKGPMVLKTTYGGDIFQGVVQGIAADIMLEGMLLCETAGYYPVMSVHDELVCETEDDSDYSVDELCDLICIVPEWVEGLPVEAEGWEGKRFTK